MGWTDHRKATDTTVVAVHRDLAVFPYGRTFGTARLELARA